MSRGEDDTCYADPSTSIQGRFKGKTICNTLAELRKRGMLCSDLHDRELLTLLEEKELKQLNAVIGLE
jgi:hypothetical protein